jgi:hypothetical protein
VQALLQGLILTGGNCFKSVSFFFAKWLLFLVKNPLKSFLFIVKFYISLLLLGFFLTASFSTFAHEVPADSGDESYVITGPLLAGFDGQPWSNRISLWESLSSQNRQNFQCSYGAVSISTDRVSQQANCTYDTQYGSKNANSLLTGDSTGAPIYTCPPSGYSDHTVLTGTTCNTPTGEHPTDPEPEPVFPTIDCTSLAGNGADFASFYSSSPLTPEELSTSKCSNNVGGNSKSDNSCHILNGAGWTGQPVFDDAGIETGINYTSINGTFSGFGCDSEGNPASKESCTAIDSGRIKKVDCPDGTSMTVNWGDFLDTKEAFLNQRSSVQDDLNAVNTRVDNVLNSVPTTDDIVISLAGNQSFKDSVKGKDGEPCEVARLGSNNGIFMNCDGNQTNIYDGSVGAKGQAGENGENGEDGQSCTAIATTDGVNIVCKESTQFLAAGKSGGDGIAGIDGADCSTTSNGAGGSIITCGSSVSEVEGVDEGGIISAIGEQTTTLMTGLTYEGDVPSVGFTNSEGLTAALGTANDYEVKNYGTVIESAVNEMKESPVFVAVDGFFEVSFNGSCPTYSANVDFMNTSVTMDHWCRPIMNDIWPIIQAIIMFGFSFMAFRVAIL